MCVISRGCDGVIQVVGGSCRDEFSVAVKGVVISVLIIMAYGGVMYSSVRSYCQHYLEVSGQPHAPAGLSPAKITGTNFVAG